MKNKILATLSAFALVATVSPAEAATGADPASATYCADGVSSYTAVTGATLLCDIASNAKTGTASSNVGEAVELDGKIIFTASSEEYGQELWITDGTAAGTRMLRDIYAGSQSSNPEGLAVHDDGINPPKVYFRATDAAHGAELWSTDGTSAGTNLVRDFYVGSTSSSPASIVSAGGRLFVSARLEGAYREILMAGAGVDPRFQAIRVSNTTGGGVRPEDRAMTYFQNALYFAGSSSNGNQLYKLNPVTRVISSVTNYPESSGGLVARELTVSGTRLYFSGSNYLEGRELFYVSGEGDTFEFDVLNPVPGDDGRDPFDLTAFGSGALVFTGYSPESGYEPYLSTGPSGATRMIADLAPGAASSFPTDLVVHENLLYFRAYRAPQVTQVMRWSLFSLSEVGGDLTYRNTEIPVSTSSSGKPVASTSLGLFFSGQAGNSYSSTLSTSRSGFEPMLASALSTSDFSPTALSKSSSEVDGGETVTINGLYLDAVTSVTIGDSLECLRDDERASESDCLLEVVSPRQIVITTPEVTETITGTLSVQSYYGTSSRGDLTVRKVLPPVTIVEVSGGQYPGDVVSVVGSGFDSVVSVTLDGVPGVPVTINAATRTDELIQFTIPTNILTTPVFQRDVILRLIADHSSASSTVRVDAQMTVRSVRGPSLDARAGKGDELTVAGTRLAKVTSATIGGVAAAVSLVTETSLVVTVPETIEPGTYDLVLTSPYSTLTTAAAVEVVAEEVPEVAPPIVDMSFKAWTKRISDTEAKMYAKNVVLQGKIRFVLNGRELAWVRAIDASDPKLRVIEEGPMAGTNYLVRTARLKEGRNVLEIYQDGERLRRVIYSR